MVLVEWKTLQRYAFDEPLSSYYIDNAIYSLAHPERQSIHLAVLAGTHSPDWLITTSGTPFQDALGTGICNPSAGGSSGSTPGSIWNTFLFSGIERPMPNPFGSNSCLWTALDNLVNKLGQTGDYRTPATSPYPEPLAPYDTLYYDAAAGRLGFVHTTTPTPTMHKIIGHVSVLGPHSYDGESVLCHEEADCQPGNTFNYDRWTALYAHDAKREEEIEKAQEQAIDIYANRFPTTYWTVDLVERQMPFFDPHGCHVPLPNPFPPTGPGPDANDASDCFGKLRADLIDYIEAYYWQRGGVQNNSLGSTPRAFANHPVWQQTALAAQAPPLNPVKLFVGFQVGQPNGFYAPADQEFRQFQSDDQTAVNWAKQMLPCYSPVAFIEFYDVDIANNFTLAALDGSPSAGSLYINRPPAVNNDDPSGFMHVPLTDAHRSLGGPAQNGPGNCQ